ncbi:zinc finger protein [Saccharopolyspora cebuensis]|uniref:zinc finger protein n=1 Tax=Saccharopolyspora cebuensis TaxID=418759 RepID=UPI0031EA05DF
MHEQFHGGQQADSASIAIGGRKYQPHPFHWVPGAGLRHASTAPNFGLYPDGEEVVTLCGALVAADNSVLAWLWRTCTVCDAEARVLAGMPKAGTR